MQSEAVDYNTQGINIPLPDGKVYNTEYPKLVNGHWCQEAWEEMFWRE